MQEYASDLLERDVCAPSNVMIVTEKNKCGTWGVAAYYQRNDGARDRRLIATCETRRDAAHALRNTWSALGVW